MQLNGELLLVSYYASDMIHGSFKGKLSTAIPTIINISETNAGNETLKGNKHFSLHFKFSHHKIFSPFQQVTTKITNLLTLCL